MSYLKLCPYTGSETLPEVPWFFSALKRTADEYIQYYSKMWVTTNYVNCSVLQGKHYVEMRDDLSVP